MLTFFETPWYLISSIIFFMIGILICILQKYLFGVSKRLSIALYLYHSAFSMYYMFYSISNISDSPYYYYSSLSKMYGFDFGTAGVVFFTSIFSDTLGMSYGGIFFVYNIIGFLGVVAFAAAMREIVGRRLEGYWPLCVLILLLPGAHFWSSAIGKDSLAFLSTGLLCWSSLQIRKRLLVCGCAIFIFFLARPHIALAALMAFGMAFIFFGNARAHARVMLALVLVPVAIAGATLTFDKVGLDRISSVSDVADYVETRQSYNMEGGSGIDISSMSVPMRAFSYLYRPMPLEISGAMGLAVGGENMALLFLCLYFLYASFKMKSNLPKFSFWAMMVFVILCLILLSNTTSNLGIAIRQKWMFVPMILCVGLSYASNFVRRNATASRTIGRDDDFTQRYVGTQ